MITLKLAQVKFPLSKTKEEIQSICTILNKIKYNQKFLIKENDQQVLCQKHRFLKMDDNDKYIIEKNYGDEIQQQKLILVFSKSNPEIRMDKMQSRGAYKNGAEMKGRPKKPDSGSCDMCRQSCVHK